MKLTKLTSAASVVALVLASLLLGAQPSLATAAPDTQLSLVDTVAVDGSPTSVAVDSVLNQLYVTTWSPGKLWVLDEATHVPIATLLLDGNPRSVAVDEATHAVYVVDTAGVTVFDGVTRELLARDSVGAYPTAVAVASTGDAYVTNSDDNTVSVINGGTHEVSDIIAVGTYPLAVAADQTTGLVYVGNNSDGTVSVIDSATKALTTTIALDGSPMGVAVDSSAGRLYVTLHYQPSIVVIETGTNTVTATIPGDSPRAIAVDDSLHAAYAANFYHSSLSVVNGSADALSQTIGVGDNPDVVAVNPLTHRVYVVNTGSSSLSVLDPITPNVVSTATASAVVLAGPRTASLEGIDLGAVPYSHDDQVSAGSITLSVDDSSGSAAGWAVTAQVSAFAWSAPGGAATDAADIAAANLAITSVGSVSTVSGQAWAADPIAVTGALNTPVTVLSAAADTGQGSYTMPVDLALTVPGTTHAGTYTATLTTTLSVAP